MAWEKPEDLELVFETDLLEEAEIVRGLLTGAGIESMIHSVADSTYVFAQKSIFGQTAKSLPYKILVRNEDAQEASDIIKATPEPDENLQE